MKNVFLFMISIFLVACSTQTAFPDEPIAIPPTLVVTPTRNSTRTPSFIPTPNRTQIAWEQLFIATQSVFQTEVAQFQRLCPENVPYFSADRNNVVSPDGLWLSEVCLSSQQGLVLTFSNKKTQVLWKMFYRDYVPDINYADGGMSVVHWSNDSRYAYFYSWLGGDGGECFFQGGDAGSGVFRLDLQTGKTRAVLPAKDTFSWYGFSFSPTDRRFVYGIKGRDFVVLDLRLGESIKVAHIKDFSQGGGYVWSPDGLQFVYSTVAYSTDYLSRLGYTLRLVDARTGVEHILFESQTDCYLAKKWTENNRLLYEQFDEIYNRTIVEYDFSSNTIIGTSTPSP